LIEPRGKSLTAPAAKVVAIAAVSRLDLPFAFRLKASVL
jgi:hypothetical protein